MINPELSIVIPVYNEEKNIAETLRRIRAFMTLKNEPWECLIVNDGSSDRTEAIARVALAAQPDQLVVGFSGRHGRLPFRMAQEFAVCLDHLSPW